MPTGEDMFKFHGYSGPCPAPPKPKASAPNEETERRRFEAFVTQSPFTRSVTRFDAEAAWPGSYRDLAVDLAWQSWRHRAGSD